LKAGVVTALTAEARTLGSLARRTDGLYAAREGNLVAVSGIGGLAAAAAAARLADAGVCALVSWGLAGGLDPALAAGTLCVPEAVVTADGVSVATHPHWRELVVAAVAARTLVHGVLLTSEHAIDDVAGKAAAFGRTGAVAVDMESAAIAHVAGTRGLPFIAVRAIVDTARDALPRAVTAASTAGQVNLLRLIRDLARTPREVAPLLRLATRYRAAMKALVAVAATGALAPAFANSAASRVA
jgi:nucleoside phosphorylase